MRRVLLDWRLGAMALLASLDQKLPVDAAPVREIKAREDWPIPTLEGMKERRGGKGQRKANKRTRWC